MMKTMPNKPKVEGYCVYVLTRYEDRHTKQWVEQWINRSAKSIDLEMAISLTTDLTAMQVAWKIVNQGGAVVKQSEYQTTSSVRAAPSGQLGGRTW